jgi:hypothetical protein
MPGQKGPEEARARAGLGKVAGSWKDQEKGYNESKETELSRGHSGGGAGDGI